MIKDFENYRKVQHFANGSTQWLKDYNDGGTAKCVVDDNCTRAMVKEAFDAQEAGVNIGCFQKSDIGKWY